MLLLSTTSPAKPPSTVSPADSRSSPCTAIRRWGRCWWGTSATWTTYAK
ncbi:unnamed protein product [Linum tenue]|uniref:Uncharacterized protein n=1 Tax=Linum tenue TaxID=586396 RepID=A0AAV0MFB9_9ROSI|nr:unnamed protein product [Linum tenue]